MTNNEKCPICEHETFVNEYGDVQCSNCRRILPVDVDQVKKEGEVDEQSK